MGYELDDDDMERAQRVLELFRHVHQKMRKMVGHSVGDQATLAQASAILVSAMMKDQV